MTLQTEMAAAGLPLGVWVVGLQVCRAGAGLPLGKEKAGRKDSETETLFVD